MNSIQIKNEERRQSLITYIEAGKHIDPETGRFKPIGVISKEAVGSSSLCHKVQEWIKVIFPEVYEARSPRGRAREKTKLQAIEAEKTRVQSEADARAEAERIEAARPVTHGELQEILKGLKLGGGKKPPVIPLLP